MKNIKTLLAFLLVFCLMFGHVGRAFAAEGDDDPNNTGNVNEQNEPGEGTEPGTDTPSGEGTEPGTGEGGEEPADNPTGTALFTYEGAGATPNGQITIRNASIGKTYTIYKVFDATLSGDASSSNPASHVAYRIPAGALKTELETNGTEYFRIVPTPDAQGNYYVTRAMTVPESGGAPVPIKDDNALIAYLRGLNTSLFTEIGSIQASGKSITFDKIPYGFYYVTSTVGTVVSLDSTDPIADMIDKNQKPKFDKWIIGHDEKGNEIKIRVNEANLDETIPYRIEVDAKNYIHIGPEDASSKGQDKKIFIYQIVDELDPGMTYTSAPVVKVDGEAPIEAATIKYYDGKGTEVDAFGTAQKFVIEINWTVGGVFAGDHLYEANAKITVDYTAILDSKKWDKVVYGTAGTATAPEAGEAPAEGDDTPASSAYIDANTNYAETNYYSYQWDEEPGDEQDPLGTLGKRLTETFTTELEILKVDENERPLTGAAFTLTNEVGERVVLTAEEVYVEDPEGEYWKLNDGTYTTTDPATEGMDQEAYADTETKYRKEVQFGEKSAVLPEGNHSIVGVVGPDGKVTFKGLGTGTYTLVESTVPNGYVKMDDITFIVAFEVDGLTVEHVSDIDKIGKPVFENPRFFIADENGEEVEESDIVLEGTTGLFKTTIMNIPGVRLPGVGGRGTVAFYLIGGAMVIGAAALLVMKRRRREEE